MEDHRSIIKMVCSGDLDEVERLLERRPELIHDTLDQDNRNTLLLSAIRNEDLNLTRFLIDKGANVKEQPFNPVMILVGAVGDRAPSELLKFLLDNGVVWPLSDENDTRNFLTFNMESILTYDNIAFFKEMIRLGFDPLRAEQIGKTSMITLALRNNYGEDKSRIADYLLELGCSLEGLGSFYYSPLTQALHNENYRFAKKLLEQGAAPDLGRSFGLYDLTMSHFEIPEKLLCDLIPNDIDFTSLDREGNSPLHCAALAGNERFLKCALSRNVDINTHNQNGNTPLHSAMSSQGKSVVKLLLDAGADINHLNKEGKTALDIALSMSSFKRVCDQLKKAGAKTHLELTQRSGESVDEGDILKTSIDPGEPWADKAIELLTELPKNKAAAWNRLIRHCLDNNSAKPSKRWLAQCDAEIDKIEETDLREQLLSIFPLIKEKRTKRSRDEIFNAYEYDQTYYISEQNTRLLKGLLWLAGRFSDPDMSRELRGVAQAMYKKVYGVGMRNAKLANAAILSLSQMPGTVGLKEIITLRSATKYNPALVNINRVFEKLAADRGVTTEQLVEISTPDYGLTDIGYFEQSFGEFMAQLQLTGVGSAELLWQKGDKSQKTIPAAIKQPYADQLKILKGLKNDLQVASRAHAQRLERMLLRADPLDLNDWREQYVDHPLVGFLARRLIWQFSEGGSELELIHTESGFVNAANETVELPEAASVRLWHPRFSSTDEVLAWRKWLMDHSVTQPFKQAHREVYILTDAERETGDHSLRFAHHILRHQQFHALAEQRGWRQQRGGSWDGGQENSAYRQFPEYSITVELDAQGLDAHGYTDSGIYQTVGLGQLEFRRRRHRLRLDSVDPLLFSEVMRDVDLFVGVSSIGQDPDCRDLDTRYWNDYGFGELTEMAVIRKEVLESLIPKLNIADQLSLEDRFLIVRGKFRTYRIHLGSSNVLMDPNDQYLCIVQGKKSGDIKLPFEGDSILSLILSKALLLAQDDKIKDSTINSQIR